MGAARGFLVPGSPHEPSPGRAPSTVTDWKRCQRRTSLCARRNWVWIQSCRSHTALEHLHIAEKVKGKTPCSELHLSEYALSLAVLCLHARVCTYMCMCVSTCVHARARTHISFDAEHRAIASYSRIILLPKLGMYARRGCLLLEITKQARGPSLLQWQPSAGSPHHVSIKEEQWL